MKTKMKLIASLKIWVVIYPSITLFLYLFGDLLSNLPLYQRTLLLTITLVPWMIFAGLPFVNFVINRIAMKKWIDKCDAPSCPPGRPTNGSSFRFLAESLEQGLGDLQVPQLVDLAAVIKFQARISEYWIPHFIYPELFQCYTPNAAPYTSPPFSKQALL